MIFRGGGYYFFDNFTNMCAILSFLSNLILETGNLAQKNKTKLTKNFKKLNIILNIINIFINYHKNDLEKYFFKKSGKKQFKNDLKVLNS